MFGKRSLDAPKSPDAPPPAPAGGTDIATRPQKVDPAGGRRGGGVRGLWSV